MYPSIKMLMTIKDVTRAEAQTIRGIMSGPKRLRMAAIDKVLRTSGVEYIAPGRGKRSPAIYYCNAGDTYAVTVLMVRGRFRVGCWGDIVEERGNYD